MQVWAIANQKGGVGKTTSAVALAGLLLERGKRVLLVDFDPHGSMTSYFRFNPDDMPQSTFDWFIDYPNLSLQGVERVLQNTAYANLKIAPASSVLATVERRMVGKEGMGLVLNKALDLIADQYDYVLIDNSPVLGVLMINALACCDQLLVPVQTEFLAIKGLDRMMHTLKMVTRSRGESLRYLVIPTLFDRRTHACVSSLRTLRNQYGDHIWHSVVPIDTRFRDASRDGALPSLQDPDGRGVRAYRALLKVLLESAPLEQLN